MKMKIITTPLVAMLALLCCAPCVWAQSPDDSQSPPVCTDLTGKVPLPCPTSGDAVATFNDEEPPNAAPVPSAAAQQPATAQGGQRERSANTVTRPAPTTAASTTSAKIAQPSVRPTIAAQPKSSEADPRALIGFYARTPPEPDPEPVEATATSRPPSGLLHNFAYDQKSFWTSPARLRLYDVQWLAPLFAGAAFSISTDTAIQPHLPTSLNTQKRAKSFSDYGAAAFAGAAGGAFLLGAATHNDHLRETGFISGEAALNSFALTYAIKSIANRDRPFEGNGRGTFFSKGDSFPSEHAAFAWSVATVVAHEYPGTLTALLAYGGAGAVSAARVIARQHFTSDAIVGSAIGYFVGRQMYKSHREHEDRTQYGVFQRAPADRPPSPDNMGSAFVPLDSWVYDAFDRLSALGYVHTAFAGLKPWTRMECMRLLGEAESALQASNGRNDAADQLLNSLKVEFAFDAETVASGRNLGAQFESFYTRVTGITGTPVHDGYHFGQTIINDYGRPYEEGLNLATGFSTRAEAGPLAFYVRGEYQHSPSGPALSDSARQTIAAVDFLPSTPPATGVATINRFRLLDAYVALNLHHWQVSAGKQSLSWGPGLGGSMMFSNNAEPIDMVRFGRVKPIQLPWIFKWMGPIRTDFFLGRLSGYEFIENPSGLVGQFDHSLQPQPSINGQKISFKPTGNLEFGFSRTTIYGGPGYPLTEHTLLHSVFSTGNQAAGSTNKAGDRRSGMDITYRIPKLRDWLTFYADGFTDDEYSPVAYFDRSAWRAGLYLARVPYVHKLDLRAEGVYTDNPLGGNLGHGFYYFNFTWRSGYTNNGSLIGSWIGREGQGAQAWATYHISPKSFIQLNFRHQKVSQEFIPGGGSLSDVGVRADVWMRPTLSLSSFVQYERWMFPVLAPGAQSNVTTSVQLTFWPRWGKP